MRMPIAVLGLLLFSCGSACYAAPQVIPRHVLQGAGITTQTTICAVGISILDSAGRPLCLICQDVNGVVRVKVDRMTLTADEVKRIGRYIDLIKEEEK